MAEILQIEKILILSYHVSLFRTVRQKLTMIVAPSNVHMCGTRL